MISKLCYLFTFILSITNILGVTSLGWGLIFTPSIVALVCNLIVLIMACILAWIANN